MATASGIDWTAIRQQYEQGVSQRSLALKYGVSQQAISKRANKEKWIASLVVPHVVIPTTSTTDEVSELSIVEKALTDLARHLENAPLDLKSHKLFADALSQYIKLKMLMPGGQEDGEQGGGAYDMREFLAGCTDEELATVRPVIAAVQQRKQAMEDEKVKPLRRIG